MYFACTPVLQAIILVFFVAPREGAWTKTSTRVPFFFRFGRRRSFARRPVTPSLFAKHGIGAAVALRPLPLVPAKAHTVGRAPAKRLRPAPPGPPSGGEKNRPPTGPRRLPSCNSSPALRGKNQPRSLGFAKHCFLANRSHRLPPGVPLLPTSWARATSGCARELGRGCEWRALRARNAPSPQVR